MTKEERPALLPMAVLRGALETGRNRLMMLQDTQTWIGLSALGIGALCLLASFVVLSRAKRTGQPRIAEYLEEADDLAEFHQAVGKALHAAMADTGATAGYVLLVENGEGETLNLAAHQAIDHSFVPVSEIGVNQGLSGLVFSNRQSILTRGRQHAGLIAEEFAISPTSAVAVPLNVIEGAAQSGRAIERAAGVMVLVTTGKAKPFGNEALKLANSYATVLSMLVHNLQMIEFSRETILSSMQEIASLLDAKDPFSVGHSKRTAEVAVRIAEQMEVPSDACHEIRAGALLLDIGKVAIPDSILKKSSGLTAEEFEIVKGHPLVSFEICRRLRMSESVLMIVRNHHERLDGTGYPDQLRGGELPLPLRIVCVADAYDAMRCARPHRRGMSPEEALHQLVLEAGTKFDPSVVEAVRELTDTQGLEDLYFTAPTEEVPHLRVA